MTTISEWDGEQQSAEDLNRKLAGTYVLASIKGEKPCVVYIESFGAVIRHASGAHSLAVGFRRSPNQKQELAAYDMFDIIKALPDPGVYTLPGEGIALIRRLPARQWTEGLSTANTLVRINGQATRLVGISWELAKALFEEQRDLSVAEAKAALVAGKTIRVNRHYWLQSEGKRSGAAVGLMRHNARIGSWNFDTFFLASNARSLCEELKDELGIYAKVS